MTDEEITTFSLTTIYDFETCKQAHDNLPKQCQNLAAMNFIYLIGTILGKTLVAMSLEVRALL